MKTRAIFLMAVLLTCASAAWPQAGAEGGSDEFTVDTARLKAEKAALAAVDPATAADIRKLVEVAGVKAQTARVMKLMMEQLRPLILDKLPPGDYREQLVDAIIADVSRRVSTDEFIDLYIPVMARHFSDGDVKGLIAFYESPLGRRYVQEQPALVTEYQTEFAQHWQKVDMPELLSGVMKKITAGHPELEGNPPQR